MLKAGDVITAVDGHPVTGPSGLTSLISAHPAGSPLTVTISRGGRTETVQVGTKESGGHPVMGVQVTQQYKFPFTVKFSVGDIGGPSAGMMFALGIIDKLTADNLTGGRFIAGTGEIEASGQVDAIGGIQQKMVGARAGGRDGLPGPRLELLRREGRDPGWPSGGQGGHAQPGRQRSRSPESRPSRPLLLSLRGCSCVLDVRPGRRAA